jgi:hypothetical protein
MQPDTLNRWEKAGLLALGAGGVVNVLFYQLGFDLADANDNPWLFAVRGLFAVCSFVGFDLTLVTAVMAMRAGRRSRWALLTALAVLIAAGGMSLDVAEVVRLPAWHAAPVVVLAVFAMHLAAPRVTHKAEVLAQQVAQTGAALEEVRNDLAHERGNLAQRDAEAARMRGELAQAGAAVAQLRRELAHAHESVAQAQLTDGAETVAVGARTLSMRQLSKLTGVAESTLRHRVAQLEEGV